MVTPLIELRDLRKSYGGGESPAVEVLHGLSLSIFAGEFVAIMGASGSGKSTLMHILGCLDRPTSGTYHFGGKDIGSLGSDQLAWLRREAFGFVFQGYHLIRSLDALRNVEMPAVYSGASVSERDTRARALLERLGLSERLTHRPNQLSGGQQQRVSIARALMNGGRIILADEPTGALDSRSGAEVMSLLKELAAAGHTIILITHDRGVASAAQRVVEIRDGTIVADTGSPPVRRANQQDLVLAMDEAARRSLSAFADVREAVRTAWRALSVNRFRTLLTLLGIVIGVASVIVMLAIGAGTQEKVIAKMAIFGTNRMYVRPGGDNSRGPGGVLTEVDVPVVREVPNVAVAMPFVEGEVTLRAGNVDKVTPLWAVTAEASRVLHWKPSRGRFFTAEDERTLATVILIGKRVRQRLFGERDAVGRYLLVNNVPFQIIGELEEKGAVSGDADDDDVVLVPFSTGSRRVLGTVNLSWISVLIDDLGQAELTARQITTALTAAHHVQDFRVYNKAATVKAQQETQETLTLLLGLIAAVSLIVGGIGVMNIMLMAVKERTREIGIRMATGARERDIRRQFLTEAMLVSLAGGIAGMLIGLAIGSALILWDVPVIFSVRAIAGAVTCALATGLLFGFIPARQAARLDPVQALASE